MSAEATSQHGPAQTGEGDPVMTTGQRAAVIGVTVGVVWIAILVALITVNQGPPPGSDDAQSLRSAVEEAVHTGDDAALQGELPAGEVGDDYAAELLNRLPADTSMFRARLDHEGETAVITVSGAGTPGPCVQWAVVVVDDRFYLDPVPLTTLCRP